MLDTVPVGLGDIITYSYRHSVEKTRVDEMMEVASDHFVVRSTVYDMTGAGLPSDLLGGDLSIDAATGKFRIDNMTLDMPDWRVRVAFTAEQTVEIHGREFRLDSLAPPATLLVLDVTSRPRILGLLD